MKTLNKQKSAGFTLMEVMVTVAILSILAVFAVSNYRHYVTKARLQEGVSALNTNYLYLEKQYAKFGGYKKSTTDFITTGDLPKRSTGNVVFDKNDKDKYKSGIGYELIINTDCSINKGSTMDTEFCIVAIPRGGQEKANGGGKECGRLTINQAGKMTAIKSDGSKSDFDCF